MQSPTTMLQRCLKLGIVHPLHMYTHNLSGWSSIGGVVLLRYAVASPVDDFVARVEVVCEGRFRLHLADARTGFSRRRLRLLMLVPE